MSHFYGSMKGSRGEATRCGTKNSGINAHVRGWHQGVRVLAVQQGGEDRFEIYGTAGSSGCLTEHYLGYWHNGTFHLEDAMAVNETELPNA